VGSNSTSFKYITMSFADSIESFLDGQKNRIASAIVLFYILLVAAFFNHRVIPPPGELAMLVQVAKELARTGSYTYSGAPNMLFLPLMPLVVSLPIKLGFDSLLSVRLLSAASMLLSCVLIYSLSMKYTANKAVSLVSVAFFASNPATFFYTLDFYRVMFFTLILLIWFNLMSNKRYVESALMSGVASLTRMQGLILLSFSLFYLIYAGKRRTFLICLLVSIILPGMWFARNIMVLHSEPFNMSYSSMLASPMSVYRSGMGIDVGPSPMVPKPHLLVLFAAFYLLPVILPFAIFGAIRYYHKLKLSIFFLLFYCLFHVTIIGGMSNIVRHLIPTLPFLCIYASYGLSKSLKSLGLKHTNLVFFTTVVLMCAIQFNMGRMNLRHDELNRGFEVAGVKWNNNLPAGSKVLLLHDLPYSYEYYSYYAPNNEYLAPSGNYTGDYYRAAYLQIYGVEPPGSVDDIMGSWRPDYVVVAEKDASPRFTSWTMAHKYYVHSLTFTEPRGVLVLKAPDSPTQDLAV
jgi:hypothetical protein